MVDFSDSSIYNKTTQLYKRANKNKLMNRMVNKNATFFFLRFVAVGQTTFSKNVLIAYSYKASFDIQKPKTL